MAIEVLQTRTTTDALLGNGVENTILTLGGLTLGRKYFFNWHAHMAHSATARSFMRFRIDGTNQPNLDGSFRGGINGVFGESIFWYGQTVATPASVASVNWGGQSFNNVNSLTSQSSIMAIALNQLVENTDYYFNEHAVPKIGIDNIFANNVGASITFTPDGVSDYAIFVVGRTNNPASNVSRNVTAMQLWDVVGAQQLTLDGRDTYTPVLDTNIIYSQNGLHVLQAPAAVPQTIQCRFIGNGNWDYKYSNIFILKLNAFQHYAFDQNITNGTVIGTGENIIDSLTWSDPSQTLTMFSRMAVDTVDADDEWGTIVRDDVSTILVNWSGSVEDFGGSNASPGGAGQPQQALLLHDEQFVGTGSLLEQRFDQVVDDGTKTIRESTLLFIGQIVVAEFEAPVVSNQVPAPGAVDVALTTDITFRIASSQAAGVNISTIDVSINRGSGFEAAIIGGIFQSGFDGPQSNITPLIDSSGFDIIIDVVDPLPTSQIIDVQIDADNLAQGVPMVTVNYSFTTAIVAFSYTFRTETFRYIVPDTYTEELDLTSIPPGFSPQTSSPGTIPTFSTMGMTTFPNGGTSYIRRTTAGFDFDQGLLIDVEVYGIGGDTKVLQINVGNQGLISVNVDFVNGEIYLTDIINTPSQGFRPNIKNDVNGEIGVQFRLSVKGSGNGLIARLYSGLANATEPILLSQTGGPSTITGIAGNFINIGSINPGGAQVRVSKVNILNLEDPDAFYPFPEIDDFFPTNDVLTGGKTLRLRFANNIDIAAGTELLFVTETLRNESTGVGSIDVFVGSLTLSLAGIGVAAARFMRSYSGDLPSAADVSVDVAVDQDMLNMLPQNEVVLAGMKLLANGDIIRVEYVADVREGTFFRIIRSSGNLETFKIIALRSTKSSFTYRFLRAGNRLIIMVDGTPLIDTNFKDGVGIIELFTRTDTNLSFDTVFTNFRVGPVIVIGGSIANA